MSFDLIISVVEIYISCLCVKIDKFFDKVLLCICRGEGYVFGL